MPISIEKEKLRQKGDNVYTFIAYKPESCCYAKGYAVEDYPSDFVYQTGLQKHIIIKTFKQYANMTLQDSEDGYDIFVLFNGVEIIKKYFDTDCEITQEDGFKQIAESILEFTNL